MSFDEFKSLSEELSKKVNFFQDLWAQNPKAEIVGGTSRDFLYWIKYRFKDLKTRADAEKEIQKLRSLAIIDIRQFVIGDSDIDLVSAEGLSIQAEDYGVRKIDPISADRLDPKSEMGINEQVQGYIPVEKIRLSSQGFISWNGFGDGVREIYEGKPSIHFTAEDVFKKGYFAKQHLNHPILLVLRYLRSLAINEFSEESDQEISVEKLKALDPSIRQQIKEVVESVLASDILKPYLAKNKFKNWLNSSIRRSFRAHSNPNIALELFKYFGIDHLAEKYPNEVEPLYQYVFRKTYQWEVVDENWRKLGTNPQEAMTSGEKEFGDSLFFHGTPSEENYRSILRQGVLPSTHGSVGMGLYGVQESNRVVALSYAQDDPSRIISFKIERDARILDLTTDPGKRLREAHNEKFDSFCDSLGVEIVKFNYRNGIAYAVKNSRVLKEAVGTNRPILSLNEILAEAHTIKNTDGLLGFYDRISLNGLSTFEWSIIFKALKPFDEEESLKKWLMLTEEMPRNNRFHLLEILLILMSESPDASRFNDTILKFLEQSRVVLTKKGSVELKKHVAAIQFMIAARSVFGRNQIKQKLGLETSDMRITFFSELLSLGDLKRSDIYSKAAVKSSYQLLSDLLLLNPNLNRLDLLDQLVKPIQMSRLSMAADFLKATLVWSMNDRRLLFAGFAVILVGFSVFNEISPIGGSDKKLIFRMLFAGLFGGAIGHWITGKKGSVPTSWYFLRTLQHLWMKKFKKDLKVKREELKATTPCKEDIQAFVPKP